MGTLLKHASHRGAYEYQQDFFVRRGHVHSSSVSALSFSFFLHYFFVSSSLQAFVCPFFMGTKGTVHVINQELE